MEESILKSIKLGLGSVEETEPFNDPVILHINAAFATMTQLGVGPEEGFAIEDDSATWDDFLQGDPRLNFVKDYVYCKVKLIFDPPTSSAAISVLKEAISEYEWRAMTVCDS